ncbi:MAG TPA: hypothetical protein VHC94_11005 [Nitrobacter sp.]|nr:hypothetical protein [Nitrobacter sp.]
MRSVLVFLILGPVIGFACSFMFDVVMTGSVPREISEGAVMTVLFSLVVSFGALFVDACLALFLPSYARVLLTAVSGAAIAIGLTGLFGFHHWMLIGLFGAFAMGVCSTLSCSLTRSPSSP